ncbi:hypothetical protein YC2023_094480 [Brassica napus]
MVGPCAFAPRHSLKAGTVTHSPDRNPAVQGSKLAGDWEILEVYLKRYKDIHARLPVTVASTLLQTDSCIEMPLWLVQMFKVSMRPAYRSSKKVLVNDKLEAEVKKNRRMISLKETLL